MFNRTAILEILLTAQSSPNTLNPTAKTSQVTLVSGGTSNQGPAFLKVLNTLVEPVINRMDSI